MLRLHRILLAAALAAAPTAAQTITTLTPNNATAGVQSPIVNFTVTGTGFVAGSVINFGATPLATTFNSATQLTATVATGLLAVPGTVLVTVENPGPVVSPTAVFTIHAPAITNLSPTAVTAGAAGFTLTVTGTNFLATSSVLWNGSTLTGSCTTTQCTATVPPGNVAGAGSASIVVSNGVSASSTAATLTVNTAPGITTNAALPNAALGNSYSQALAVSGGTAPFTWSATGLPAGLTIAPASGLISGTPLSSGSFTPQITATDASGVTAVKNFTLSVIATPTITNLSPSTAPAGVATVALTITGTGFESNATVEFGGALLTPGSVTSTQLNVTVPVALIATAGPVNVTVSNPFTPSPLTSAPSAFTVNGPAISSLSPAAVSAGLATFTLTVNGSNFVNGSTYQSAIRWNGAPLTTAFVSTGQLTAQVPANLVSSAGTAQITVANTPTAISTASPLTILPAPILTSLSPDSASAGAPGFTLTVAGSGFLAGASVQWGATALATTFAGATQVTAVVPASLLLTPGAVDITLVNPGPAASAPLVFTVGAAPSITAIQPAATTAGALAFTLTVSGSGFNSSSVVRFSGQQLATSFLSSTQLLALVPSNLITLQGTAQIIVVNTGPVVSNSASLPVNAPAQFVTTALTQALAGAAYTQAVTVSGGTPPYQFAFTNGSFPPGLSLAGGNGAITGTPSAAGAYEFVLQVTDAAGFSVSRAFQLTVASSLSIATEAALPTGAAGMAYSVQLAATGGALPYSAWQVTTGTLPAGLALNAASGLLAGTPTHTGSFGFLIQVRDNVGQTASKGFTLVVNAGLSITSTAQPPTANIGAAYAFALAAAGGTQPYTWSVAAGTLPAGLTLNAANGAITGTPTVVGSFAVTIEVRDATGQSAQAPYTFEVLSGLSISTPPTLPTATARVSYSVQLQASGGTAPYANWRIIAGSVPAALVLNAATGELSGTPSTGGDFSFNVAVNDSASRTATKPFTLTVLPAPLAITTSATLPAAPLGVSYAATLQADGGTPPYRWILTSGSLPAGLSLSGNGAIGGTPTAAGTAAFGVTVLDAASRSVARDFLLAVASPTLPGFTLSGLADIVEAASQPRLALTLAAPYPTPLSGSVAATFEPDTVNTPASPAGDPALQFANGTRSIRFTIPAGATSAEFEGTPALQTGTVAGTIVLTPSFASGSVPVPGVTAPRTVRVLRSAPLLRSVTATRTAAGFDVAVSGFSTPREVTQAVFRFTSASGANLQTSELTLPLTSAASAWFTSDTSHAYGSQFTYRQTFTLSGEAGAVASVTVTLSNATGASQPVQAIVP